MARRRISTTIGDYSYAVTVEGSDEDVVDDAAAAGADAVDAFLTDDPAQDEPDDDGDDE